jgi:hypothetical protein
VKVSRNLVGASGLALLFGGLAQAQITPTVRSNQPVMQPTVTAPVTASAPLQAASPTSDLSLCNTPQTKMDAKPDKRDSCPALPTR